MRAFMLSMLLGVAAAGSAEAQHSIGVSAQIVDAVVPEEVRAEGEAGVAPSLLLERMRVEGAVLPESAVRALVRDAAGVRLERRESPSPAVREERDPVVVTRYVVVNA